MRQLRAAQQESVAAGAEIVVAVQTSAEPCPCCGGPLVVQKSVRHAGATLAHGVFTARETVRVCAAGCTQPSGAKVTRGSASLRALVAPGSVYGYDVEVFVGCWRRECLVPNAGGQCAASRPARGATDGLRSPGW